MIDTSKVDVRGEWSCGDGLKITLTVDMLPAEGIVNQIETQIKSLRSLYFEFVIVDLQKGDTVDKEYPVYFQMLRNREFGQTHTYLIELGMAVDRGTIHYIKDTYRCYEYDATRCRRAEHKVSRYEKLKPILVDMVKSIRCNGSRISVRQAMAFLDKYSDENIWQCLSPVNVKEIKQHIG